MRRPAKLPTGRRYGPCELSAINPSVGSGSSNAVTARPADLRARKYHESGFRPNPVGGVRPDGEVRPDGGEAMERQKHGPSFHDSVFLYPKTKMAIFPLTNSIYRSPRAPKSGTPCTAIWSSPSTSWTAP